MKGGRIRKEGGPGSNLNMTKTELGKNDKEGRKNTATKLLESHQTNKTTTNQPPEPPTT